MAEVKITTVRTIKSWEGLRVNVPRDVIEAAQLEPGDFVGIFVDPDKPGEFAVRRLIKSTIPARKKA